MVLVSELPLVAVVALVNGWGTIPRVEAGEQDLPYPEIDDRTRVLSLGKATAPRRAALVVAADRLYPVFAAASSTQRARRTARLLRQSGVRPTLTTTADGIRAGWTVDRAEEALIGAAAVALRGHLEEHDGERLGICTATQCADVYVDASPGGHRRYCSITCQNRTRVAAFRRRTLRAGSDV